ncbi:MAG: four helix bundle protein [Arcicella sp.]|nr:four helix bundle protein [Arcicella sp.]
MATLNRFEEIKAWQKAREVDKKIFQFSSRSDFSKDYDLKSQIRRAGGSVMDNIAEGFGRGGNREFIQFLGISKGSANEVKSQLYRVLDRNYITDEEFRITYDQISEVIRMTDSLIGYLTQTEIKGRKFSKTEVKTTL